MGKTTSQDHCTSSDSVPEESYGKHGQACSRAEISQPIFPYAYADPYSTGLYTAYGPHNMVMAAAAVRIPLPPHILEDGPIYVNAKQYNGILRRRQTRAKLEAQNKLVKNRKPYLHESRHRHALNRVRGSGGRFLSTKKGHRSDSPRSTGPESSAAARISFPLSEKTNGYDPAHSSAESTTRDSTSRDSGSQQQERSGYSSSISSRNLQSNGGLAYNSNRHYASIVR